MGILVYSAIASLDGYVEDGTGDFRWAAPDHEVHAFINDLERPIGTYLYGRRMYDTMVYWETEGGAASDPPVSRDFAVVWRTAPQGSGSMCSWPAISSPVNPTVRPRSRT
jgi:dihydrofolate reductase